MIKLVLYDHIFLTW